MNCSPRVANCRAFPQNLPMLFFDGARRRAFFSIFKKGLPICPFAPPWLFFPISAAFSAL
jgi:hypothetical protein